MADFSTLAGTWTFDVYHTNLSFTARHAMVTKVRGKFEDFAGKITIDGENPSNSSVEVTIQANSIDTGNEMRDNHVRNNDFLDIEKYPTITFKSTSVEVDDDEIKVTGDLTIKETTKSVSFDLDWEGPVQDPQGNTRLGFEGKLDINRQDYGVAFSAAMETGGVLVSDKVQIGLDVSAIKDQA